MTIILALLTILLGYLSFRLLVQTAKGGRWITYQRYSRHDDATVIRFLQDAWDKTGLLFASAPAIDDRDDGTRTAHWTKKGRKFNVRLQRLEGLARNEIAKSTISDTADTKGEWIEHWCVNPEGPGSRITYSAKVDTNLVSVVSHMINAWLQLKRVAACREESFRAAGASFAKPQVLVRRIAKTPFDISNYSFEIMTSLLAFASLLTNYDIESAIQLTLVILLHEYGHLLSFKMTGKEGNRLMLLPFMGGIATSKTPHKSEFDRAFCALAGPAICVPLSLVAAGYVNFFDPPGAVADWIWGMLYFSCLLNALNLLPIFPLDGGQVFEGFVRTFSRNSVVPILGVFSILGLMFLVGEGFEQTAVFFAILCVPSLLRRGNVPSMRPMNAKEGALILIGYLATALTHAGIYYYWWL